MRTARWLILALWGLLGAACTPVTMAYPVRAHLGPTPEPLGRGMGATQVNAGVILAGPWSPNPGVGGLRQFLGLTSWLDLDADFVMAGAGLPYESYMGSLGLRFYPVRHRVFKVGLSAGGALGCGGTQATGEDEDDYLGGCGPGAPGRLAGGGYAELLLGLRPVSWLGIYAGVRYQIADTLHLPRTHYVQYGGGVEFSFPGSRLLFVTTEYGVAHFYNSADHGFGQYIMGSFGVRYGKASW